MWSYRIVKYANRDRYGLHKVYYDDDGNPTSMDHEVPEFVGDNEQEVHESLLKAVTDSSTNFVFFEPSEWNQS